ncbi:MAG: hypothetical protein NTW49_11340 [Bacteroidia bacterium]|nr:hypothetical protein [Bacteroidia bacterium]
MVIDTKSSVVKVKFRFMLTWVLTLAFFGVYLLTDYIRGTALIFSIIALIVAFYIWFFVKDYNYIYFSDESNKYILRYFNFIPMVLSQKSIEIPKESLVKYTIEKSAFGLRENLVLFEKTKRGIAKYPNVSLTLLTPEQKEQLLKTLKIL